MEYSRDDDYNFIKWALAVKQRDFFTCQICGASGVMLNSHHMNGWNWCVEERYDIDNGQTLCINCHDCFHKIYGKGYNTIQQYKEFEEFSKMFNNILNERSLEERIIFKIISEIRKKIEEEERPEK